MTLQYAIEEIQDHFPNLGQTLIQAQINKTYRKFCLASRIYRAEVNLTLTSTVEYTLPADIGSVYRIDITGEDGNEVAYAPSYVIEHGTIKFHDFDGSELTEMPSTVSTVTLNYYKIPDDLTTLSSEFAIDEEFHDYIVAGALSDLYSRFPVEIQKQTQGGGLATVISKDWNSVSHFNKKYREGVIEAKRKGNNGQDDTQYQPAIINLS